MSLLFFVIYLMIGLSAGFLSGLLGIGGGLITVPSLILLFHFLDFPADYLMQVAIGTSLGSMVFTSAVSAWAHYAKEGIDWDFFYFLSPGMVIGAVLGALIAVHLPGKELKAIFGFSECLLGIYFLSPLSNQKEGRHIQFTFLFQGFLVTMGIVIGVISTILGIGGGVITVPFLTALRTPIKSAISTSAATGFIIALIGAFSFLYSGWGKQTMSGTLGYLYIPAFIVIGFVSCLAAPYGAKMVYQLPAKILKQLFGLVLILIGIFMFISITY